MAEEQIAVLGAGSWGTALAALLAANGLRVCLWARDATLAQTIYEERENRRYLPGIALPEQIEAVSDPVQGLSGASVVVFAVPSGAMREVAQRVGSFVPPNALLLSAAKGLEAETGLRMSRVLAETIPGAEARTVVLSGPNLAMEMARGAPTAGVVASANSGAALAIQRLFTHQAVPTLRLYTSRDVIGVELGGAIKNVIAIGAGVSDGLGYGDNAKAALMTRGLTEAIRLGVAQGAEAQTFMGLSGVGDLIATGASRLSRNYRVEFGLGAGRSLPNILEALGQVAEGVPTTHVLYDLAQRSGVEMPLCTALYRLLFEGRAAPDMIRDLMLRPPGSE